MKSLDFRRYALSSYVAAALLAGCGGSQPPIGAPGAVINPGQRATPSSERDGLLYVSLPYSVEIYTYPNGKPFASISIPSGPSGMCADKAGNVYVTETNGLVAEYPHGATTPTASARVFGTPHSCTVDHVTGKLAVSNENGSIAIFTNFPSTPTLYNVPETGSLYFCTYDSSGNLFVDGRWYQGVKQHSSNGLLELPKNGSSLTAVRLPFGIIRTGAGIQWDGHYLAIQALRNSHTFDRVSVRDFHGTVVSTVTLSGEPSFDRYQFAFKDGRVIKPGADSKGVGFWRYPAGGRVQKRIKIHDYTFGITISFL
jgi:hypothetical protein